MTSKSYSPRRGRIYATAVGRGVSHVLFGMALGVFIGCSSSSSDPNTERFGYDFYPLELGAYRHYNVTELLYSQNIADTLVYQMRESVTDSFPGSSGEQVYVLSRYTRLTDQEPWALDSTWSSYTNLRQAVLNKNGIPTLVLVFPFVEDLRWDGNALNAQATDEFKMQGLFEAYQSDSAMFTETATVVQEENLDSLIFLDYRREVFARQIGLVDKIDTQLVFCQDQGCLGQKFIDHGRSYRQTLFEHGIE